MTNLLKTLAISGAFALCLVGNLGAMESIRDAKNTINEEPKTKTSLQIVQATSFTINDDRSWGVWQAEDFFVKRNVVTDYDYEWYSTRHNIGIKTLRGDNFKPREFWDQPFSEIFRILYPEIRAYKIIDIIRFCRNSDDYDCFSSSNRPYSFSDVASLDFPEVVECLFEDAVLEKINKFMKQNGLEPIGYYDFQESLHNYYFEDSVSKKPIKECGIKPRTIPLFEYFMPHFDHG